MTDTLLPSLSEEAHSPGLIPAGGVPAAEYLATLDALVGPMRRDLDGAAGAPPPVPAVQQEATLRAQAAAVLAALTGLSASRWHDDRAQWEAALRYAAVPLDWAATGSYSPSGTWDFGALQLYRFLTHGGSRVPSALRDRIVAFIVDCAERCHVGAAYINHHLNEALVCAHAAALTGDQRHWRRCLAKTRASLYYFDRFDGRNPEISQVYGIYGISVLVELAHACRSYDPTFADSLAPYVAASAETLPAYYLDERTGDFLAITSREPVKSVMAIAPVLSLDGFELIAGLLRDGRYRSLARLLFDYWQRTVRQPATEADSGDTFRMFPRWQRNDEAAPFHLARHRLADWAGLATVAAAYDLLRTLDYYPEGVDPAPFPVLEEVCGEHTFHRRRCGPRGAALGVLSNVLYSPVAYVIAGGAGVVGQVVQGGTAGATLEERARQVVFLPSNDWQASWHGPVGAGAWGLGTGAARRRENTETGRAAEAEAAATQPPAPSSQPPEVAAACAYSHTTGTYSTAFFHSDTLVWVLSLAQPTQRLWCDNYVYLAPGGVLWGCDAATGEVSSGFQVPSPEFAKERPPELGTRNPEPRTRRGLRWVLLGGGGELPALAVAVLGTPGHSTPTLAVKRGAVAIEYPDLPPEAAAAHVPDSGGAPPVRSSVVLFRHWEDTPEAFAAWHGRWRVLARRENWYAQRRGLTGRQSWQLNTPDEAIYLVEHGNEQPFVARLG